MKRTVLLTDGERFFKYRFIGDPRLLEDALRIFCCLKGLRPYEMKEPDHFEIINLQRQGQALPKIRS